MGVKREVAAKSGEQAVQPADGTGWSGISFSDVLRKAAIYFASLITPSSYR